MPIKAVCAKVEAVEAVKVSARTRARVTPARAERMEVCPSFLSILQLYFTALVAHSRSRTLAHRIIFPGGNSLRARASRLVHYGYLNRHIYSRSISSYGTLSSPYSNSLIDFPVPQQWQQIRYTVGTTRANPNAVHATSGLGGWHNQPSMVPRPS